MAIGGGGRQVGGWWGQAPPPSIYVKKGPDPTQSYSAIPLIGTAFSNISVTLRDLSLSVPFWAEMKVTATLDPSTA